MHALESIYGAAFNNIEHCVAQDTISESVAFGHFRHDGSAEGVTDENQVRRFVPPRPLSCQVHHEDKVLRKSGETEVLVIRRDSFAMATCVDGEDAGGREHFANLGSHEGERKTGGAGAVVCHEQRTGRTRWGEVYMVDGGV